MNSVLTMMNMVFRISILFICLLVCTSTVNAQNLQAYFSYCNFKSPDKGPYLETYVTVIGKSAVYKKKANGKFQAAIQISLTLKQDTVVKYFDKYNLLSPEHDDSVNINFDFLDQQRITVPNGRYLLGISIADNNSNSSTFSLEQPIKIDYQKDSLSISDIELLSSYKKAEKITPLTKSGFDLVPYTSNFYPNHLTHLKFYTEIYNTDKVIPGQSFLVRYSVKSYETKQVVASLSNFSKQTAKPVNVVMGIFPIDKLPSGNYHLTIEVVDKTNKLLDQRRIFFQRSNQLSPLETIISVTLSRGFTLKFDKAQIQEYVKCLSPISSEMELVFAQNALGSNDSTIMQKYFQAFWEKRNTEEPESEWSKYFKNVKIAEKLYGTRILNGFETDRGRVYLKYGLPNDKVISDFETYAYPYELWQYNKAGNQSNVKFVFYNPDMVTNDYQLIHSDVIGEIRNRGWKTLLYGRSHYSTDFDDSGDLGKQYGDRSHDLFDD